MLLSILPDLLAILRSDGAFACEIAQKAISCQGVCSDNLVDRYRMEKALILRTFAGMYLV